VGARGGVEVLTVTLVASQLYPSLRHVQRVPEVVRDDAGELREPIVLSLQFRAPIVETAGPRSRVERRLGCRREDLCEMLVGPVEHAGLGLADRDGSVLADGEDHQAPEPRSSVERARRLDVVVHPGFARLERLPVETPAVRGEHLPHGQYLFDPLRDRDGDEPAGVLVRQPNGDHGEPEHLDDALGDLLRGVSLDETSGRVVEPL